MNSLSRLILHPDFELTLQELSNRHVFLPPAGQPEDFAGAASAITDSGLVTPVEDIGVRALDAKRGRDYAASAVLSAYDESWLRFSALEGTAYFTTHSLVVTTERDYLPVVLATFNFYTRSRALSEKSPLIKYSEAVDVDYHRDYLRDKVSFLLDHVPNGCVLLIDGPLISGDLYTIMADAQGLLLDKGILPVFFVKNSVSNVVTENSEELRGRYNSDMHWLNELLKVGQRSSFFKYQDQHNPKNSKVFAYIKAIDASPQRVEFHLQTFLKYEASVASVMDLVFYLMLVQGSVVNPQVRPIAVAEQYARALLSYIDIDKEFKRARITPTINQVRFGGQL